MTCCSSSNPRIQLRSRAAMRREPSDDSASFPPDDHAHELVRGNQLNAGRVCPAGNRYLDAKIAIESRNMQPGSSGPICVQPRYGLQRALSQKDRKSACGLDIRESEAREIFLHSPPDAD